MLLKSARRALILLVHSAGESVANTSAKYLRTDAVSSKHGRHNACWGKHKLGTVTLCTMQIANRHAHTVPANTVLCDLTTAPITLLKLEQAGPGLCSMLTR